MPVKEKARLAVDIGGTFTDVVLQTASGQQYSTKVLTTHKEPGQAVLQGIGSLLNEAHLSGEDVGLILHGTTLATNALVERRGACTALLTTQGHRDVLEMAHEDRFDQYDIDINRPAPLVPRYLRLAVQERLDRNGQVLVPLQEASVYDCLDALDRHQVESVAIGYLHAFVNPEHELRTAEILQRERPDLALTLASEVCPEIREYERLSTACANAYVQPLMAGYLNELEQKLRQLGLNCPFLLMTSGGGLTTLETAARFPIRLVESGPAGGAILAEHVAQSGGHRKMLAFDMGGTTAKLSLIDNFQAMHSRSFEVDRAYRFLKGSGLPVRIPVIEMVEIGAGGGSIATVDHLERIRVGPTSAGSDPGPAVYGLGGTRPTVSDADALLGRLYEPTFAAGSLRMDPSAARRSINNDIAEPLNYTPDKAAFGITEVVDENMAAAARAHAAEFGLDLASRDMVAFGGAAPLHAARLGEKLGVDRIIIPAAAGVGSAVGFLLAPIAYQVVRSRQQRLDHLHNSALNELFQAMRKEALAVVEDGLRAVAVQSPIEEQRQAYMRYVGQGHELAVDIPVEAFDEHSQGVLRELFENAYAALYGRIIEGVPIEVLSWTLSLSSSVNEGPVGSSGRSRRETLTDDGVSHGRPEPADSQACFDAASGAWVETPIVHRANFRPGQVVDGPALIVEAQTTTVVSSVYQARLDADENIVLERRHGN